MSSSSSSFVSIAGEPLLCSTCSHPYHSHASYCSAQNPPLFTSSDCYDSHHAHHPHHAVHHSLSPSSPSLSSPSSSSSLLSFHSLSYPSTGTLFPSPPSSASFASYPIISLLCFSFVLLSLLLFLLHFGSSPSFLSVLSRMRPHFGHSSQLLQASPSSLAFAPSESQQQWLVADSRRVEGGGFVDSSPIGPKEDEEKRRFSVISTYLDTPRKAFLSPPPPPPSVRAPPASSTPSPPFLVTAGRYWCTSPADLLRLSSFLSAASKYSDLILLAVNIEKDHCLTQQYIDESPHAAIVKVVPVLPYFSSTSAMNALLITAFHLHATYILYQSTFITAQPFHTNLLLSHFSPSTLVVGICLPSHSTACDKAGDAVLTAQSCPSNAFAIWHVDSAVMVGWGVAEEGGMIGLLQRSEGARVQAKLVNVRGGKGVEGVDAQELKRLENRGKKFKEMERMGWSTGRVTVVVEEQRESLSDDAMPLAKEKSSIRIGH